MVFPLSASNNFVKLGAKLGSMSIDSSCPMRLSVSGSECRGGSLQRLHLTEHLSRCDSDSGSLPLLLPLLADAGVVASGSPGI